MKREELLHFSTRATQWSQTETWGWGKAGKSEVGGGWQISMSGGGEGRC